MKAGYKQTEIGLIPEDWEVYSFKDIGIIKMCKRIMKDQTSSKGKIPFFKIGTFGKEPDAFISRSLFNEYKKKYSYPRKGDILISAAGTIGRTVVFDGKPSYFQDSNIVWIENNEELILNKYFYHILQIIKYNTEQATIQRLYNDIIYNTKLTFPALKPEQTAIAQVLSDTDALIDGLKALIAKKQAIKQGAMQELLTGKTRLKDENGKIFEGEWEEKSLGETYKKTTTGKLDANAMVENGEYAFFTCAQKVYRIDCFAYETEALLISGNGAYVGYVHYFNGKFNAYQRTYVLENFIENIFFIKALLEFQFREYIKEELNAGSTPFIKLGTITEMPIKIPKSLKEQTAIAQVLSDMDAEIELLEVRLQKTEQLKQGMMQELLTGRTRLDLSRLDYQSEDEVWGMAAEDGEEYNRK